MRRGIVALNFLVLTSIVYAPRVLGAPVAVNPHFAVEAEIVNAAKHIDGVTGVAAWRLDGKGDRIELNANAPFPMASTFKVAVAGAVLSKVDAGQLSLQQMVPLDEMMRVDSDIVADRLIHPGISFSVYNWLELMLTESDNTATDMLVKLAGGPAAVTKWVRSQGVNDLRVDNDTAGVLERFLHLPKGPFVPTIQAATANGTFQDREAIAYPDFDDAPEDTTTPKAMADLLTRIFSGRALSPGSTTAMREMMQRCRTDSKRMRALMPPGTIVASKTGTIGGTANSVGVISLPNSGGDIVLAIYIKKSNRPTPEREPVIAEIARTVRDYYLFYR